MLSNNFLFYAISLQYRDFLNTKSESDDMILEHFIHEKSKRDNELCLFKIIESLVILKE